MRIQFRRRRGFATIAAVGLVAGAAAGLALAQGHPPESLDSDPQSPPAAAAATAPQPADQGATTPDWVQVPPGEANTTATGPEPVRVPIPPASPPAPPRHQTLADTTPAAPAVQAPTGQASAPQAPANSAPGAPSPGAQPPAGQTQAQAAPPAKDKDWTDTMSDGFHTFAAKVTWAAGQAEKKAYWGASQAASLTHKHASWGARQAGVKGKWGADQFLKGMKTAGRTIAGAFGGGSKDQTPPATQAQPPAQPQAQPSDQPAPGPAPGKPINLLPPEQAPASNQAN